MPSSTRGIFFIAIVVSIGGFVFGFDASVISGVVGYVSQEWGLDVWQQGMVVSAPSLAAIIASLTVAPLSDVFGRKRLLVCVAVLYLVSAVASALAPGFLTLVLARAIGGLAFGSLMLTPIYVAEIAPARLRGVLVSVGQMNIVVGLSAAYFANYVLVALSHRPDSWIVDLGIAAHTWRWMLGLEIIPAVVWVFLLMFIPESPRWLIVRQRPAEAREILLRLMPATEAEAEMAEVRSSLQASRPALGARLRALFNRKLWFVLFIGAVVAIAQQITGINCVFFFATSIFELSGIGRDAAFAQAVWVGVINVVFTIVAMLLIDRLGRRPLLVGGLAGVVLSLSVAAYGFHQARYYLDEPALAKVATKLEPARLAPLKDWEFSNDLAYKRELTSRLGKDVFRANEALLVQAGTHMNPLIVLAGILGFVASFAVSLGPVMWVLLSEIFPNQLRGLGMAAIGFLNAGISFLVQFLFPWELATLGNAGTFLLYAAFGVIGLALVYRYLPETKGKTLEQLETTLMAPGTARS